MSRLRREWDAFLDGARSLDRQAAFVLIASVVLVFLQLQFGSKRVFRAEFAEYFPVELHGILSWAWWFGFQGFTGFVLPVLALLILFRRTPAEMGLGLGDWKLAVAIAGLYLPLVAIGTWVLSDQPSFLRTYPHFGAAATDWNLFLTYEALYLFYWIGWEYLWRGFVLFGTAPALGAPMAIVIQTVPFAILHADKPVAEAYLSILGGLALGALVWRCRSFWIAVPIHAAQMMLLDLFCSLRTRTGASGIGFDALAQAVSGFGG